MAILTASTIEPSVQSLHHQKSDLFSNFGLVRLAFHFQAVVSAALCVVARHAWFAASVAVTFALRATRVIAFWIFGTTRWVATNTASLSASFSCILWNSKPMRRLRKKLEYEFFTLVLGPGGNALCLMVFWPGWLLLLPMLWVLWLAVSRTGHSLSVDPKGV